MNHVKQTVHYWCGDTSSGKCRGQGVGIAVLDTGIVPHPDLRGRIRGFKDCVNHRAGLYDDSGHGTHVAGILAGNGYMSRGVYAGMAPQADLCVIKVLDQNGQGSVSQIIEGIKWLIENRKKYQIRIVNISAGGGHGMEPDKEDELVWQVERLWDLGMVVVTSAGNHGPEKGTVAVPGVSRKVITVGMAEEGWKNDYHSGCGPTRECVIKPDVVAPGRQIISCLHRHTSSRPYTAKSGTSMATPVVSGAVALTLGKYPDMSNVEVKLRLRDCCDKKSSPHYFLGWGLVNQEKLLNFPAVDL